MTDAEEPIIWMRPEVSGHGKAPAHSRDQIAKAAVAIADAEGIEAVSMRRVAREIGAGTMSLYRYVRNKEELYALMVDAVLGPDEPRGGPGADWQDMLRDLGRSVRQMVFDHPWFPALQAGMPAPSPKMFRAVESLLVALDRGGLEIDEMLEAMMTVMVFAMGQAQDELAETRALFRSGLDRSQWQERQGPYITWLIESGDYPYLRRIVVDAAIPHEGTDKVFERALNRIITGIAATARGGRPTPEGA